MSLTRSQMSVDLGRGTRRFQRFVTRGGAKPTGGSAPQPRGILDPDLLRAALPQAFRKLDPRLLIKNPVMFVVEITAALVTLIAIANVTGIQPATGAGRPRASRSRSRSGCGSPSSSRPTPRPSPRRAAGPRRRPCADPLGDDGPSPPRRRLARGRSARPSCARATSSSSRRARRSPATATSSRASASSTKSAITGESAPVLKEPGTDIRSSVTGGTTLTSDRLVDPRHGQPGRDLPRPDDRPGRGRQAPADAQRDRPVDPAGRPDDRLPDGRRHPAAVRRLRRHDRRHRRPRRPPRVPDPDHDRRPAVGHRHRRHGPRRPLQRPGHERPGGRGVRRRRRDPARQDRHDHLRQPPRRLDHGRSRRHRGGGCSTAALVASIHDETPEGRSIVELARKRLAELGRPAGTADDAGYQALAATIAEDIPFRAETRTSGVRLAERRDGPQGRRRRDRARPRRRPAAAHP